VNRTRLLLAFSCVSFLPVAAQAATVASTSIPNGTYTGKVVKVVDAKHVDVVLDNGQEATLPAGRPYVDFSKIQTNDQIKLSLIGGNVMVFLDLTSH
jgi:translation initiation factor IF-1